MIEKYEQKAIPCKKIGYKWFANRLCELFIVTLEINNEQIVEREYRKFAGERITTDCIVKKITRIRDKKDFPRISGSAFFPFRYEVGQHITGETVYYCDSLPMLYASQAEPMGIKYHIHNSIMRLIKYYNTTHDVVIREKLKEIMDQAMYFVGKEPNTDH